MPSLYNLPTILVSRDTNMRVKATILGIQAEDFRNEKVASVEEQYTGRAIVYASSGIIDTFHQDDGNYMDPDNLRSFDEATHHMAPLDLVVYHHVSPQYDRTQGNRASKLCFQVTLNHDECERSPLAAEASIRL